ncbi:RnfABCDGE type electron transport complex subunit B [Candidatus Poribacteria bacterium]|nr:RnfABCDGE type electron transport complex subunit B [Candidatus Poribacteria bacterium]
MSVLIAVGIIGIVSFILAIGLGYASNRFAVKVEPKVKEVEESLAGLNCGVCGYPGCRNYAEAIVHKNVDIDKCAPGERETVLKIARIMDINVENFVPKVAVVRCQGSNKETTSRFEYRGVKDCRMANSLGAGFKSCSYGCLGLGSCARACPFDAITMNDDGLPVVDEEKCTACGVCVETCPRNIMELIPRNQKFYLACINKESGKNVSNICQVGCIACKQCVKNNPEDEAGISMDGKLPVVDYDVIKQWDKANEVCPKSCFAFRKDNII